MPGALLPSRRSGVMSALQAPEPAGQSIDLAFPRLVGEGIPARPRRHGEKQLAGLVRADGAGLRALRGVAEGDVLAQVEAEPGTPGDIR
jgi:hypothetical protein